MIRTKRAYDPPDSEDGERILVDRLWPRGVKKHDLKLERWAKEVAPSTELRRWFGHQPQRWQVFRERYFAELDVRPESWLPILRRSREVDVTLIYAARDTRHNHAEALREYLEGQPTDRVEPGLS